MKITNSNQLTKLFKQKTIVPIIGSGFNVHKFTDHNLDWHELLKQVSRKLGLKNINQDLLNQNCVASWEDLIRQLVQKNPDKATYQIEKLAKKEVANILKQAKPTPHESTFDLTQFSNIISLNFDNYLQAKGSAPKGQKLNRNLEYKKALKSSTIWYPHGNISSYESIILGTRDYGMYITKLNHAFKQYKQKERRYIKKQDYKKLTTISLTELNNSITARTWLAMNANLLFLGCSLSPEEWPMWWFFKSTS